MNDEVTRALSAAQGGGRFDADAVAPILYRELRLLAERQMSSERVGHTLQPTALVHEAWAALAGPGEFDWRSRTHFRAAASRCMRRVLVDHARRRNALRHGDGREPVPISEVDVGLEAPVDVLELAEALERLAARSERGAKVVELRFFAGLSEEEVALSLGISERSVRREWRTARAWLRRELAAEECPEAHPDEPSA